MGRTYSVRRTFKEGLSLTRNQRPDHMRHLLLLAATMLLGGFSSLAQSDELRTYGSTTAFDRVALKHVIQAMVDIDPNAQVFHSDDMMIIQVKASAAVSDSEIRSAIQSTGLQLREGTPDLSTYYPAPAADSPPLYVVSGNESEDLERYRAAVAAWNLQHPDQQYDAVPLHMNDR
jgi:hypothetical protein